MAVQKYSFLPPFELAVLRQVLSDPLLAARVLPTLQPARFHDENVQLLLEVACEIHRNSGKPPSTLAALQAVQHRVHSGQLPATKVTDCALTLERAEEQTPVESLHIQEVLLGEARKQAVWDALDYGLRTHKRGDYEGLADRLNKALAIGKIDSSPAQFYHQGLADRTAARKSGQTVRRFGTGLLELDDRLAGGLGQGELGVLIGAPKMGKTQGLGNIAVNTCAMGGAAFYYSMEASEAELSDRIDAAISRTPILELRSRADFVQTAVDQWMSDSGGCIYIKQFPSYETTAKDLEEHTQMVSSERSIRPTVIIADSGDLMAPSRQGDSRYDLMLGSVYSELRGMAVRWKVPMWTASWANRDSLNKEKVGMADIADSWRKVAIADLGVAICGTEKEMEAHLLRLWVAWCRFAPGGFGLGPYRNAFSIGRMIDDSDAGEGEAF